MMKYAVVALAASQASAYSVVDTNSRSQRSTTRMFAEYEPMEGEGKINLKIDLDSPKVANMEDISSGKKVFCRCWLSGTFPLCDGTHVKHNAACGDNVGPLIVSVKSV